MSVLNDIQQGYKSHRPEIANNLRALMEANGKLEQLLANEKLELPRLTPRELEERKRFYAEEKQQLSEQVSRLKDKQRGLIGDFHHLSTEFFRELDPRRTITELNDAFPILLFPLRLETRFKSTGTQPQLWIRVYPDDCNISHKEEMLSESELSNAKLFWTGIWKARGIETEEKAAWKTLVNNHGSGRSAWIIREFKPLNARPTVPDTILKVLVIDAALALSPTETTAANDYWIAIWLAGNDTTKINDAENALITATSAAKATEIKQQYIPLNIADAVIPGIDASSVRIEKIQWPDYVPKQTSWTQAAETMALPDKFVVTLFRGAVNRAVLFTSPVKDRLQTSPDPSLQDSEQIQKDPDGNLIMNEGLQWMVDFEKAVEVGMATKIDLSPEESLQGFDKLMVTGIRFSASADTGKEQLEQLLETHFYSKHGFGLLKQGTSTNNIEDEPSGFARTDDPDESYQRIFRGGEDFITTEDLDKKSDGEKLADCLGIDATLLRTTPNANGKDQLEANAMNKALFPATLGYFMEEMMDPLFTDHDIDATRTFFSNFVSGRGPVPAIRIGRQPYGILPISVYSRLRFSEAESSPITSLNNRNIPFLARLHALIMKMDTRWDAMVPNVAHTGKRGDSQQILLDVIGLHPTSVEFHQRYSQTIAQVYNQLVLQTGPLFANSIALSIARRSRRILTELGIDPSIKLPILEKFFVGRPNLLGGPLIDDVPDSEIDAIRVYCERTGIPLNYIEWLTHSTADVIRMEHFEGNSAPTALLYLLLRHALMQAQAAAATNLLVTNQVISNKKAFYDPEFIHVGDKTGGRSKFEHLYERFPAITGNNEWTLAEYIHRNEVLNTVDDVKRLKETLQALSVLEKTPTARLERLFAEHLDCCHYRIDAWKTGLVQYKLMEQRSIERRDNEPRKGLYLGAYGWLLEVRPSPKIRSNVELSSELNEIFNKGNQSPLQTDSANLGYIHAPSLNQAATAAILRNAWHSNQSQGSGNPFAINLDSKRVRLAENILEGMRNGMSMAALLGYQFERGLHDAHSLGADEVDMFIYPLRKQFPLVADTLLSTKTTAADVSEAVTTNNLGDDSKAIQTIEANNVIDGLKLIEHVQKATNKRYPFDIPASAHMPVASPTQLPAINAEVQHLINMHDAVADLVMAEQVYQVVQGNFDRAGGNAEAFSKGSYPPEVAVKDTPRTGITITHKTGIQFDATVTASATDNPRVKAEPAVNQWLKNIFPDPAKVCCLVSFESPVQVETTIEITQALLRLQPLDLLNAFNLDTEQGMTELDDRITQYVRYNISNHPNTSVSIHYTRPVNNIDKTKVSFFEFSSLIQSVGKIILGAKQVQDGTIHVANLQARVNGLLTNATAQKSTVDTLLANSQAIPDFSDIEQLVQDVSTVFLDIALVIAQTGTGFMLESINGVYRNIFSKLDGVIERWNQMQVAFDTLMTGFDPAGVPSQQLALLQKAERIISTQPDPSPPADFNLYKTTVVDAKYAAFVVKLNALKALKTNNRLNVTDFISDAEAVLPTLPDHDLIPLDFENETKALSQLKLDIQAALVNMQSLLDQKITGATPLITEGRTNTLLEAARLLMGESGMLLPIYDLPPAIANEIENAYTDGVNESILDFSKTKDGRAFPMEDWLGGIARVREKMHHWETIGFLSKAFKPAASTDLVPMQFPFRANDRWLAMKFKDENDPNETFTITTDTLCQTIHFAASFDKTKSQCGLIFDEWTEVIPADQETTGITFHYDQPNSEPPQTMLLVTPPQLTGHWKWENIIDAMVETLEMAKKRAVEPSQIENGAFAQFLPTTMMAVTMHWITVATNLSINNNVYAKLNSN